MLYISCGSKHEISSFTFLTLAALLWKQIRTERRRKQIIVFVMWKTLASLSGIFPLKTTCKVGLHHKTPTLQFPRLVLYEPREPHPEERNTIDSNASLNWKIGYTIWTFHWRLCCSTKNITITAFIGSKTVEVAERLQRKTIAKKPHRKTAGHWSWDVMGEMSVLDVRAKVRGSTTISQNTLGSLGSNERWVKYSCLL